MRSPEFLTCKVDHIANDPDPPIIPNWTVNNPQIGPQTIPGPELIPPQKVMDAVDSILRMDFHIFNYPR